jgi:hypothetical protein
MRGMDFIFVVQEHRLARKGMCLTRTWREKIRAGGPVPGAGIFDFQATGRANALALEYAPDLLVVERAGRGCIDQVPVDQRGHAVVPVAVGVVESQGEDLGAAVIGNCFKDGAATGPSWAFNGLFCSSDLACPLSGSRDSRRFLGEAFVARVDHCGQETGEEEVMIQLFHRYAFRLRVRFPGLDASGIETMKCRGDARSGKKSERKF